MDEITISLTKTEAAALLCVVDESSRSDKSFSKYLIDFKKRLEGAMIIFYGQHKHSKP